MAHEGRQLRVLVIDDDRAIADTLGLILQAAGYTALPSYSAADARKAFALFEPQLVLADVILGDGTGLELAIEFQKATPDGKVLLFSGAVTAEDLRAMAPEGADFDFLSKPVDPRHMVQLISNMFEPALPATA